jgi:putative YhdH/YhfP family quinone oxidoreductase
MDKTFKAVVIEEVDGKWKACFKTLGLSDLPLHDVLVEVEFSSLNYKDGLAVSGRQKIARKPPLIAGGDLAGTVIESASPEWRVGDRVVVNGWGLSETQAGGNTAYQRVKPDWLVRIPDRFTTRQAMAIGTAGYTAALCVEAIETWGVRDSGDVLVTGAAGGVGSVAIALLATRSLRVTASTGRPSTHDYLAKLGATGFVPREELAVSGAPLQKEKWGAAIDSVGGATLVNVLSQTIYGGAVAACGLAGGAEMPKATVLPHILRGIALLGIDSVMAPRVKREQAWARLTRDLKLDSLDEMTTVEPMTNLPALAESILAGQIRGRVVIDVRH